MQRRPNKSIHPRYVVLEGPKGVGKTTLIDRLQRHVAATGLQVAWVAPTRAPRTPHPLEEALARELERRPDDALRERFFALRSELAAAATDWSAPLILGDRSVLTSYVTRLRNFASPAAAIAHVDAMEPSIPLPATVLYLDAPLETLLARVAHRGARPDCIDEQAERIEVVVPDEQLSLAIGRRGQNVRLASQLIGWDIDILTEQEESERRQKEFTERSTLFMKALDVDEMVAQLLASEGFSSVEELAYIDLAEIASIQGFDEETAGEIQNRAAEYLAAIERENDDERKKLGVADELYEIPGLTAAMLVALGAEGVKTIEDFAGCAADDLVGWSERKDGETKRFEGTFKDFPVSREEAEDMILQARLKAGWITEADLAVDADAQEGAPV